MGRMYTVTTGPLAATAAKDMLTLAAPADLIVAVHWWQITNSSDAGDAESEQLRAILSRVAAAGSGGSSVTPVKLSEGDVASSVTCTKTNTTQAATPSTIDARSFNVMAGVEVIYTPESRPIISPSKIAVLSLETVPADSITLEAIICFEEIGG